jgi:hypothetical protein
MTHVVYRLTDVHGEVVRDILADDQPGAAVPGTTAVLGTTATRGTSNGVTPLVFPAALGVGSTNLPSHSRE